MNKHEQIIKLVEFAKSQIGYKETGKNITKYSAYFEGTDFYNGSKGDGKTWGCDWCDLFVDYCFCNVFGMEEGRVMLCQPKKSAGAGCKYSAGYYKQAGRWHTSPEVGDQIFFYVGNDINHTGIVTKVADGKVFTVEGNADNAVKEHKFALDNKKIAGYGRPRWNEEANTIADAAPTKPTPTVPQNTQNTALKSEDEIAREVIAGKWGNGNERKKKLTEAGYNYESIQKKVNELLTKKPTTAKSDTFIGTVNTSRLPLNVRSGAGTKFPVKKLLPKDSKIELYNRNYNGWYKLADGSGYVSANYIAR